MLEFLCELVFEFLASIFFESTAEAAESSKVPVWLRLTLVSVLCVAVISVIILACFAAYRWHCGGGRLRGYCRISDCIVDFGLP